MNANIKQWLRGILYAGICIIAILLGGLFAGGFAPHAYAAAFGFVPFGGDIKSETICNEGYLLYLGPPSSFPVLVPYGKTYLHNVFRPGGWVIGLSAGGSPCTVGNTVVGTGLRAFQSEVIFVGTSL